MFWRKIKKEPCPHFGEASHESRNLNRCLVANAPINSSSGDTSLKKGREAKSHDRHNTQSTDYDACEEDEIKGIQEAESKDSQGEFKRTSRIQETTSL